MRRDRSMRSGGCGSAGMVVWLVASVVLVGARLGLAQAINDPRRGIHMSNCTFTSGHRNALLAMNPKMVLASTMWLDGNMASYLRNDLDAGAEIIVRRQPTTCAQGYENGNYGVAYVSPSDLAYEIVSKYWYYHDTYQLNVTRWIPGNEPELEWSGDPWDVNKWAAIGTYYSQVWDQVEYWKTHYPGKPAAPIELYAPSFANFSSVGVGNYWADPNNHPYPEDGQYVRRYGLGHNPGHNWMYNPDSNSHPIGLNVSQVRSMIEKYQRFTWHNYWHPGIAWEHRTHQWFPQWLRERLYGPVAYYPSRITEAGWIIDALQQWPDWDAWVTPPVAWAGYYETDIKYFLDNCCGAGGVAIWLLDDGGEFLPMAAVDANDNPRPWFNGLIRLLNGLTPSRLATIERSPATLAPSCLQGSNAASQSFTIRNSGWGTLSYSITDNVSWLSVTPTSGTSTGETDTITVNYSTSSLAPGTYNGTITITASGASNSPQNIGVALTVTALPTIERSPAALSPSCVQGSNAASQTFTIRNSGGGTLNYSISDNVSWLSVTPTSGTSTGETDTITVNYSTSSLAPGTYNGTITITASGASNSPQTIAVTLTVNLPPLIITNLAATNIAACAAAIRWDTNAASTSRVYYRVNGSSTWSNLYDTSLVTTHAMWLSGLSPSTTYQYYVESTRSGYQTATSSVQTFTTQVPLSMLVYNVQATSTYNSATVTWKSTPSATSRVYYRVNGTSTWSNVYNASVVSSHVMNLSGLSANTTYQYYVESTRDCYQTATSPVYTFTTGAANGGVLAGIVRARCVDFASGQEIIFPLSGARVSVAGLTVLSQLDGTYSISSVPAGTYQASCSHSSCFIVQPVSVTIVSGQTTTLDWLLNWKYDCGGGGGGGVPQ